MHIAAEKCRKWMGSSERVMKDEMGLRTALTALESSTPRNETAQRPPQGSGVRVTRYGNWLDGDVTLSYRAQ